MPTTALRKVTIALPSQVLGEMEQVAKKRKTAVDKLIRQLVENLLRQDKKTNLADRLREGYVVNAVRDVAISEEFRFAESDKNLRQAAPRKSSW